MVESLQMLPARELLQRAGSAPFSGPMLDIAPDRPLTVVDVAESDVDILVSQLRRIYPENHVIIATPAMNGYFELQVEPLAVAENWRSAQRLHTIIAFLRSPDGCPWDRKQDLQSLAPKVAEEAYEVIDAIEEGDPLELAGELGDLLLIVALLTQIAEEQGAFTIEDVYELVNRKLIRRHPHVFGDEAADTPEAVLSTWQRIKREERGGSAKPRSTYDRLPKSMPAIAKAAIMLDDSQNTPAPNELPDGARLLQMIEGMLAAGRDVESELQAALDRKYTSN